MLYLSLILFLLALLFWFASRRWKQTGLPRGRIIYSDTRAWGAVENALYNAELGLTGKPDYLIELNEKVIPVEVKSRPAPATPYDSHIYQLAAYCLLVERKYHQRPPYGIIHYLDRDFIVDYTPSLQSAVLNLLADIRRNESCDEVARSHQEKHRCLGCSYRDMCDQSLA